MGHRASPDRVAGTRLEVWQDRFQYDSERYWKILDAVCAAAKEHGATPAQVSLAWLLMRPSVSSVIVGARSLAQLEDNLKAADLRLPATTLATLDEVSALELGYPYDFIRRAQGHW